ncbi:unnamed protein product [Didymodactylos carnosus]|uniref:Uncharacterized protein n=1 Tax=Didymodactylos carnosus TaxID=1234261 RepID=A0A816B6S7_9BILA|nr:unnamed protein product [Didymodactylos carnosus]CAF4486301.1 unnamed protein product [Didymodactylos carnosus]
MARSKKAIKQQKANRRRGSGTKKAPTKRLNASGNEQSSALNDQTSASTSSGSPVMTNFVPSTSFKIVKPYNYVGKCPLTRFGVYGIIEEFGIPLCPDESQTSTHLLRYHLVNVHRMNYECAKKLILALMNKADVNELVFKKDDHVAISNLKYTCPLSSKDSLLFKDHPLWRNCPCLIGNEGCIDKLRPNELKKHMRLHHNIEDEASLQYILTNSPDFLQ